LPSSAWCGGEQNKFIFMFICLERQAELEGRHSQARAWERDKCYLFIVFVGLQKATTQPTKLTLTRAFF
jgi:hypothetical protein